MEFTANEKDLLLNSLKMELLSLRQMKNNLVRRNLHDGNQNMVIEKRMEKVCLLMDKISRD